jgi:hypothetical protein
MVLAQEEVSNKDTTDRLKVLYAAVKQRNIPSILVITKIETADKELLNSSGTIKVKTASGGANSTAVRRLRDMSNLYRSARVRVALESSTRAMSGVRIRYPQLCSCRPSS